MKVLLDTHIFIWYTEGSSKLSPAALAAVENAEHRYLSIASLWEMQIKVSLERLDLKLPLQTLIFEECRLNDFRVLPITQDHIYALAHLSKHHSDPFDRMLIAQARHENLALVTADEKISKYDVETVW